MTDTFYIKTSNTNKVVGEYCAAFVCVAAEAADCGGGAIASDGW